MMQMTCPFCHMEFPYENDATDKRYQELGTRLYLVQSQLQNINKTPKKNWTKEMRKEHKQLLKQFETLSSERRELKAFRKSAEKRREEIEWGTFRQLVRERIGEAEYMKLWEKVREELQPYDIKSLARHEFTTSKKPVITIDKL